MEKKDLSVVLNIHCKYKIYKENCKYIDDPVAEVFINAKDVNISIDYDGYFAVEDDSGSYIDAKSLNYLFFDNKQKKYFISLFHLPKQESEQAMKNVKTIIYLYKRFFWI